MRKKQASKKKAIDMRQPEQVPNGANAPKYDDDFYDLDDDFIDDHDMDQVHDEIAPDLYEGVQMQSEEQANNKDEEIEI